ncbi:hypothetical protein [Demequina maris]|uniref:hypothetical protein n=1 Tax=Demequina maris TaxID=1638982 RepID=UPI0007812E82|nr:hypothetical protein [Demequina maris]
MTTVAGAPARPSGRLIASILALAAALTFLVPAAARAADAPLNTEQPSIGGAYLVGETVTAEAGTWTPEPDTFDYEWFVDDALVGAGDSYTIAAADLDGALQLKVTAHLTDAPDGVAWSEPFAVSAGVLDAFTTSISGVLVVGRTLTAALPATGDVTVQWRRDGKAIAGATASTYTVKAVDAGHVLSVRVVRSQPGYLTQVSIAKASATVKKAFATTAAPTISGTRAVGKTLTANVKPWSPTASFSYQWKRDGVAISGATNRTYALKAKDLGARIAVTVTGRKSGYATVSRTSGATAAIAKGTIVAPTPTITGTVRAGSTLTARTGTVKPSTVAKSFQWLRNGNPIAGATKATYALKNVDAGKRIAVKVKYSKTAFTAVTKKSAATVTVKARPEVAVKDGYYRVGTDIKPGTYYRTGSGICYWERLSAKSYDTDALNGSNIGLGRSYVTIKSTDKWFYTEDCGGWTRFDGTGANKSSVTAKVGTYAVGTDIKAGTYRSPAATGFTFAGEPFEMCIIIVESAPLGVMDVATQEAYYEVGDPVEVTVAKGEYLTSFGCGKLTRVS